MSRQAFEGETVSEVLAVVIMKDPDWSALPSDLPAAIERLIRRCHVKDPRWRLQSIGQARIAIEEDISDSPPDASLFVAIAAPQIPACDTLGPLPDASPHYDVSSDGQRFLMIQPEEPAKVAPAAPGLHLALNWFRDLPGTTQE